jgi:hypothetical protein
MGLGYRVFNAGEVLSAANINNYLMKQSVMTFASSGARGSALGTAVEEGMTSYLDDVNTLEIYDGAAWKQIFPLSSINSITAAYTATATDANDTIYVSGTAAVTITVPDVLTIGERIDIWRNAGGTVTIAAGTGVTDWAGAGTAGTAVTFKIDQTYNAATVQKVAANTYRVVGKVSV